MDINTISSFLFLWFALLLWVILFYDTFTQQGKLFHHICELNKELNGKRLSIIYVICVVLKCPQYCQWGCFLNMEIKFQFVKLYPQLFSFIITILVSVTNSVLFICKFTAFALILSRVVYFNVVWLIAPDVFLDQFTGHYVFMGTHLSSWI